MEFEIVKTAKDIYKNVLAFPQEQPEIQSVLKGNPRYFLYINQNNKYYFAFSKFCGQKDISLNKYICEVYNSTQGAPIQKNISKILEKNWIPFGKINSDVQQAFITWIEDKIRINNLDKLKFLEVTLENTNLLNITPILKNEYKLSKVTFEKLLARKKDIGDIGEEIAYEYEKQRIGTQGKVDKVYINNVVAGYDIYSIDKEGNQRFIEVKATLSQNTEFYLSENEWKVLKEKGNKGFIYFLHILNIAEMKAEITEIQNPIRYIESKGSIAELKTYKITL